MQTLSDLIHNVGGVLATATGLLFQAHPLQPAPPVISLADGTYSNACCGRLTLHSGTLRIAEYSVRYTLGRDAEGLFALPAKLVEVSSASKLMISNRPATYKIRIETSDHPSWIEIENTETRGTYLFSR